MVGTHASRLQRFRIALKVCYDSASWLVATALAAVLRYDAPNVVPWRHVLGIALLLAITYLAYGGVMAMVHGRAPTGSTDDILQVVRTAVAAGVLVALFNLSWLYIARTVPIGATICFLVLATLGRLVWRMAVERVQPFEDPPVSPTKVLVVGAGEAGRELVTSMVRDPRHEWEPVGLVDDDRGKRHLRVRGVHVLGDTAAIPQLVERTHAQTAVVAIPSASAEAMTRISSSIRSAGAEVKVLPSTSELLRDHVGIRDIRDVNLGDVLGRKQVDLDLESIADYLTGRRVLVTGAGGSIGSELCRQISKFGPSELIMLDRDESALHGVELLLTGRALLDDHDVVLCDIRDEAALGHVFMGRRPEVVFHAAALKHLPMLEQYPMEAVKTNVIGTRNVLAAADQAGVDRLVNVSTDKAANPSSVLGYSKRLAERLTADYARRTSGTYLSVRFGNVLGSRGSVLTAFARQIAQGGPVTVTHPQVDRYFMTIEEACQLVVQAGAIGRPGETLVLDMGEPVKIVDVARQLISLNHGSVEIEFTGLREGEKLHEDLFGTDEPRDVRPWHPLVSHVPVEPLPTDEVDGLPTEGRRADVIAALALASHDTPKGVRHIPWSEGVDGDLTWFPD
jgi:FlaA1/EpsC-like NDP-sugar epimerase